MVQTTSLIIARNATITKVKVTDGIAMNADTMAATTMIDAMTTLVAMRRTSRKIPTRKEMITNTIIQKKGRGHAQ